MRILVVEDEEAIREIIVELCAGISSDISEAKNGMEGFKLLKEKKFDLVISDYQMPKMSGLDLLQACKNENIRVPTIWLSGRDNPELKEYAWAYGLFDYLDKPFEIEDFKKSMSIVSMMDEDLKKAFFTDYQASSFEIPYAVARQYIAKPTLRSFFAYCESEKLSPTEMVMKMKSEH